MFTEDQLKEFYLMAIESETGIKPASSSVESIGSYTVTYKSTIGNTTIYLKDVVIRGEGNLGDVIIVKKDIDGKWWLYF